MGEWTVLAHGDRGAAVSRCPEGHIHVDYGVMTLRFDNEAFLAFTRTLGEAARRISGLSGQSFHRPDPADRAWFSPN